MLVKKELMTVPVGKRPTCKGTKTWSITAGTVILKKSGHVLAADFFKNGNHYSRFFCDGKNYIVLFVERNIWSKGYPITCGRWSYVDANSSAESDEIVQKFLPKSSHVYAKNAGNIIQNFVVERNSEKRDKARDAFYKLMQHHMDMFPEYPDNLKDYCRENVFSYDYIFVSPKGTKGSRIGRCSRCGEKFQTDKAVVSGKKTVCPQCGTSAVFRGTWIKSELYDSSTICIASKVEGQLLLRWVNVHRNFCYPEFNENISFGDYAYSLYLKMNGAQKIYTYKYFSAPYAYGADWHRLGVGETCHEQSFIYTDNLNEVFGQSYYNVNLKTGLEGRKVNIDFVRLLDELRNTPKAEYLFKIGLPILASVASSVEGNPDGQGVFQKEIGLSKQYLPMMRKLSITFPEYKMLKASKEWVPESLMQLYRTFKIRDIGQFNDLVAVCGLSRTLNYLERQQKTHSKVKLGRLVTWFRDYINMSNELQVDMSHKSVMFPADIAEAHQTITDRYNASKNEIAVAKEAHLDPDFHERVERLYADLGISEFENGEFAVILPQKRTDLIREGQSLNHCVGGEMYYKNHLGGKRMIFFIRRKSAINRPFFTMELDVQTGQIMQLYGFGDCSPQKEVREFAKIFAKYIQRQKVRKTA